MSTSTLDHPEAEPLDRRAEPPRVDPSDLPEPAAVAASTAVPRSFAGYRLTTLALVAVIAGLVVWNAWITREVITLRRHKIVSVSLASIITDFVQTQARQPGSPDEAAARTKMYVFATQKALLELAKNGTPIVASEAVLGNSVPDATAQVKASVARAMAPQADQH